MSMFSLATTATEISGAFTRRKDASDAISEHASKCSELVDDIHELLMILDGAAQVPHYTYIILTSLRPLHYQFVSCRENLQKIEQRVKCAGILKRFNMVQEIAKKMEATYDDFLHLRQGIQYIMLNLDLVQFVGTKMDQLIAIDAPKKKKCVRWKERVEPTEGVLVNSITKNDFELHLLTMGKLTVANKNALDQYGDL